MMIGLKMKNRLSYKKQSVDSSDIPGLEGGDEVKERKGSKILASNKPSIRLSVLLAQIKPGKNSYKLKLKSDKYCIFCISTIKPPKMFPTN